MQQLTSPQWLVKHQRHSAALAVLSKFHANGDAEDALVLWEMAEIQEALDRETSQHQTSYVDFLKSPGNRRRLAVLISLCVGLNWMGNGVIS